MESDPNLDRASVERLAYAIYRADPSTSAKLPKDEFGHAWTIVICDEMELFRLGGISEEALRAWSSCSP
jgi:hypothetical protein